MLTLSKKTNHIAIKWKIVPNHWSDYVAEDNIIPGNVGFFAILDGHGGSDVS